MGNKSLTARGVRLRLTRAGVDYSALSIVEQTTRARDAWNGGPWETFTEVKISGPKVALDAAYWALFATGLSVAGYPDHSIWSRR